RGVADRVVGDVVDETHAVRVSTAASTTEATRRRSVPGAFFIRLVSAPSALTFYDPERWVVPTEARPCEERSSPAPRSRPLRRSPCRGPSPFGAEHSTHHGNAQISQPRSRLSPGRRSTGRAQRRGGGRWPRYR